MRIILDSQADSKQIFPAMKATELMPAKNTLPIIKRGNRFILQKSFKGHGQKQVPLGTDKKTAETRAKRFLATAEVNGFECAYEELLGKSPLKKGDDPTFEQIKELYQSFIKQSANPPRERTIETNLNRLKNVMDKGGFKTVGAINKNEIFKKWFGNDSPTPSQKRTFSSAIRAASSVFKLTALDYYKSRNLKIENPFLGIELVNPKVKPYSPISDKLRESIWNDCQTELSAPEAMIVLMALGIGMRRQEIEHAALSWFSVQADKVIVTIQQTKDFTPKNGETGMVPISLDLYETLLNLRGDSQQAYFVPYSNETPKDRLWTITTKVCEWLRKKGLNDSKPLHALRKECGSQIAKNKSVLEAAKVLRQSVQVCSVFYAGIAEVSTVDMGASFKVEKTPEELLAAKMGISLDELLKRLAAQG